MVNRARLSRPPRILVASDQNHALSDLESFLGEHGYSVLREFAGAAVLERARAVRPDVILLDARLADRPSLDLSRALRDDPVIGPSRPILLLATGQPTPLDHLAALRAGIWELLPLPLNPSGLLLRLDTFVRAQLEADRTRRAGGRGDGVVHGAGTSAPGGGTAAPGVPSQCRSGVRGIRTRPRLPARLGNRGRGVGGCGAARRPVA